MNFSALLSLFWVSAIYARPAPSCSDKVSSIKCSSSKSSKCSESSSLHDNTKCSRELQAIVHFPSQVEAFEESSKLEREFKAIGQVLFTPQNASYVWAFEQKYGVQVHISDGFGYSWIYSINPPTVVYEPKEDMSRPYAHSQINFPGFAYNSANQNYYYTFNIFSLEGELLVVTITDQVEEQKG